MEYLPPANSNGNEPHVSDEWADAMVRTVAHLAAQLAITQIRLRALASELAARDAATGAAVSGRVASLAESDAGSYLRENLGEILADVIDVEALERDVVTYLVETAKSSDQE
jgi:hypothetical protein